MRTPIFAALAATALLAPAATLAADGYTGNLAQPAGYDPQRQVLCVYPEHEGILIMRADCRPVQAWLAEREHLRQELRDQQRLSQMRNH
jgi:hypothetical protein